MVRSQRSRMLNVPACIAMFAVLALVSCFQPPPQPPEEENAQGGQYQVPGNGQTYKPQPSGSPQPGSGDAFQQPSPTLDPTSIHGGPVSNGSGGPKGSVQNIAFTASNGLTSRYKINAPTDVGPTRTYGLHVHFHGDGGNGFDDPPNLSFKYNLIGVSIRAPGTFNIQWGRDTGRINHAEYAHELIQKEILPKYNIRTDRIYFSGVSGGAYFLSTLFIPMYGAVYKSGAFLMCGGMAPIVSISNPSFLRDFKIYWQATQGERAQILNDMQQSRNAYQTALTPFLNGANLKSLQDYEIAGAGGHCEFDNMGYSDGIKSMVDRKFQVIVTK